MNEGRESISNAEEIQTIIRVYYEQLYTNKLGKTEPGRNRKPEQTQNQQGN